MIELVKKKKNWQKKTQELSQFNKYLKHRMKRNGKKLKNKK